MGSIAQNILKYFFPHYAKEGVTILAGDVISKFLTFLVSVIIIKFVTPEEYSYFGAFITLVAMVNQLADAGLNQSFIRFYSKYKDEDPVKAQTYLRFSFRMKCVMLPIAAIVLYSLSSILSIKFFHTDQLILPLQLLSLGLIGGGLYEFMISVFQARQQYTKLSLFRLLEAFGKMLYVAAVIIIGLFSLIQVYIAYVTVPLFIGFIALLFFSDQGRAARYDWRVVGKEVFRFGKWMTVVSLASMLYMKLDMLLIQYLLPADKTSVGLYSFANRLCQPMSVIAGSVATLLYPKAMALRNLMETKSFVRYSIRLTLPISFLVLIYAGVVYVTIPSIAAGYSGAFPIFLILCMGWIFTIIVNPITMLILTIGKSHIVALITIIQLILTIILHTIFIQWLGSIGAAISSVTIWFIAGSGSLWYLHRNKHVMDDIYKSSV